MSAADILDGLLKANLAAGAAILAVVALRKAARMRFGARLAYGLWLLPLLAGAAVLLPARQVVVVRTAAPLVRVAFHIARGARPVPEVTAPTTLDASTLLVGLWLAGMAAAALAMAVLQHRFVIRARLGGVGPAVVGLIAPRILVPSDFAERYGAEEQALVLAHEEAHLKRQDCRLNGLVAALQCLNWFNPLVHLAARLMRVDQELACDETVANRFPDARRAYAEVLMKAQLAVMPLPLGCYWPSRSRHPLVERVAMLKRPRVGRARWRTGAVVLGCLWAGAGLAAWASQPAQVRTVLRAAPIAETTPDSGGGAARSASASDLPVALAVAQADTPKPLGGPRDLGPTEGRLIDHVAFKGNRSVKDARLRAVVQEQPGSVFRWSDAGADADQILGLYAEEGWQVATAKVTTVDRPNQRVDLVFVIDEGANTGPPPRPILVAPPARTSATSENSVIDHVTFEGNAHLPDDLLRGAVQAQPGGVFSSVLGGADVGRIRDLYRRAGWASASARTRIALLPNNHIDLTFMVFEGPGVSADAPGVWQFAADEVVPNDDWVQFKGDVAFMEGDWRMTADRAVVPAPKDKVLDVRTATWDGHVFIDTGDDAVRADHAVYDGATKTITLSGHVAVERGHGVVKDDKLVINVKK
jgi:beta-lactamase regulating signal transducer with metallopeptidase domain